MNVIPTDFNDLFVLEPNLLGDARGYFMESYSRKTLLGNNIDVNFVQDNQSSSRKGVLRGLHFQNAPHAQTKLVRVLSGTILDVVVDLRREQKSFGKYYAIELSSENKKQLLIPKGFAHGFAVVSEQAEVFYKCDEYYHPASDGGLIYNDPSIGIQWGFEDKDLILSEKDKIHPRLSEGKFKF